MKLRLIILFSLLSTLIYAQVGMGQWRTHFSYNEMSQVEETPTKVFGVSDGALFSINKEDNTIDTYSKITGQNDFSISFVRYNPTVNALLIAYQNGNIDLLFPEEIENIADIKNKTIAASKTANDILFVNEYAYISCGIGVVVVNLSKKEITDTYIIGANSTPVEVKSIAFLGDSIYALTADGFYVANKNNNMLVDYNNWHYRTNATLTSPANKRLVNFNNKLYLLKTSGEVYNSTDAINFSIFNNSQFFIGLRISDNNLLLHSSNVLLKYNQSLGLETSTGLKITDAVYNNSENIYWVASADSTGLLKIQSGSIIQQIKPDGPATNKIFNVVKQGERLYALTGGKWEADYSFITGSVMIYDFEKNSWKNIIEKQVNPYTLPIKFQDLTHIAVDPTDATHFFVSTYGWGLFEFRNDSFYLRHSADNSGLENSGAPGWSIIDGVLFDKQNNLWLCNDYCPNTVKVLQNNGSWLSLAYTPIKGANSFDKIIITENGLKWLNRPRGGGIFVFDDKGNPSSPTTHQYKEYSSVIDQDGNSVDINRSYAAVEDLDGDVWVGSLKGPVVFNNIEDIFTSDYRANRPKIPRNDGSAYADYLLEGERINAIAVDGANRKWLGTGSSGAYLMSEDGLETIQHFTTENSPILSNAILSITINQESGEVFFATDMGLISYMSDASMSKKTYDTISVYPNPVRENFTGVITINGLMDETTVKITDTNGNLVYQTKSNGGIATWNGYNSFGVKVSTGVYFVMVSNATEKNTENAQTAVGKILIIK